MEAAFGGEIDFAQLVKSHRVDDDGKELVEVLKNVVSGSPVERVNRTVRMSKPPCDQAYGRIFQACVATRRDDAGAGHLLKLLSGTSYVEDDAGDGCRIDGREASRRQLYHCRDCGYRSVGKRVEAGLRRSGESPLLSDFVITRFKSSHYSCDK